MDLDSMIDYSRHTVMKNGNLDEKTIINDGVKNIDLLISKIEIEAENLKEEGNLKGMVKGSARKKSKIQKVRKLLKKIDLELYKFRLYRSFVRKILRKLYHKFFRPESISAKKILNRNDRIFLKNLYTNIFKRQPDLDGERHWLIALRTMQITQLELLYLFPKTEEGIRCGKSIKGKKIKFCFIRMLRRLMEIPIIGSLIRFLWNFFGLFKSIWTSRLEQVLEEIYTYEDMADDISNKTDNIGIELKKTAEAFEHRMEDIRGSVEKTVIRSEKENERFENIETNLQNYNEVVQSFQGNIAEFENVMGEYEKSVLDVKKELDKISRHYVKMVAGLQRDTVNVGVPIKTDTVAGETDYLQKNDYSTVDYFDFENHFRGSRENVKEKQKIYIPYFLNRKNVLDLGCGRGEFLELLKDNRIPCLGVDLYDEFVEFCRVKELRAEKADAIQYLRNCAEADGIFAGQVVEHFNIDQIKELCDLAYKKLCKGAYLIMETPNPTSLAIYTESFYIDPSHNKPVHPKTLSYLAGKAGFEDVKILFTETSRMPCRIPRIDGENLTNMDEFNNSMQTVNEMLFGSQDYAIIARK